MYMTKFHYDNFDVFMFSGVQFPRFPEFQIPRIPDFQISRFPDDSRARPQTVFRRGTHGLAGGRTGSESGDFLRNLAFRVGEMRASVTKFRFFLSGRAVQ